MNSDTPRTDVEQQPTSHIYHRFRASNFTEAIQWVYADFARTLERELNAAKQEIDGLTQKVAYLSKDERQHWTDYERAAVNLIACRKERDQLRSANEKLVEALSYCKTFAWHEHIGGQNNCHLCAVINEALAAHSATKP